MKKMKLFYVLMGSALVIGACTKRVDTPSNNSTVTVVITPRDTTALYGDSIYFTIVASSTNTLSTAAFTQSLNGDAATQVGSPTALTNSNERFKIKYLVPTGTPGKIKLTCTVTDNKGSTDTASAFITVLPDINSYTGVHLASYNSASGIGSFFSTSNDSVYNKVRAFANQRFVDMIFYYDATNLYTLAAPKDASFGTAAGQVSADSVQYWTSTTTNTTTFFLISSITSLSGITYGTQIKDAFVGGTPYSPGTLANNLMQGQIIGFQTEAGKSGLLQIENPNGGDATGNGALTINVVVQK